MFKKFFKTLLEILFPPFCLGCKKYLSVKTEKELLLCARCYATIDIHNSFFCPECNNRLPPTVIVNNQWSMVNGHRHSQFILAAATSYQNSVVREIIHELKYNRTTSAMKPIGKIIERYLANIIQNSKFKIPNSIVIPIPLHSKKLRERGFNQSELIAKAITIKLTTYDVVNFEIETKNLIRIKNTDSQTKLDKEKRRANVENCFALKNPAAISGKNIILIDDVFTSGATMREAVKILKSAGAKKIIGFVVAKT